MRNKLKKPKNENLKSSWNANRKSWKYYGFCQGLIYKMDFLIKIFVPTLFFRMLKSSIGIGEN
jgi:hypothetical protein